MGLHIYTKIDTIKENNTSKIYLVRNEINQLYYIQHELKEYKLEIYNILKNIDSLYLPKIYEVIEENQKLYIIEEFINAQTLDYYILNNELTKNTISLIFNQLCDAIETLHNHGIIHRDIKPENIFYDGRKIILFDFNISRQYNENMNTDTKILGSAGYAAPEQFGFQQTDERSDIYSLGVTLNMMYTSQLPKDKLYDGEEKRIIEKAIQLDPIKRYKSVNEMKIDFNQKTKSYLDSCKLPGFRKGKIENKILAVIGYISIGYLSVTSKVEDVTPKQAVGTKITTFIIVISCIFYFCNYCHIKDLRLFNFKNKYLRFLESVFILILIVFSEIMITSLIFYE